MPLLKQGKPKGAILDYTLGDVIDQTPGVKMAKSQFNNLTMAMWMGPWKDKILALWKPVQEAKGTTDSVSLLRKEPANIAQKTIHEDGFAGAKWDSLPNQFWCKIKSDVGKALTMNIGRHWASKPMDEVRNKIIQYIGTFSTENAAHEKWPDNDLLNPFKYNLPRAYQSNLNGAKLLSDNQIGELLAAVNAHHKMVKALGPATIARECRAEARMWNKALAKVIKGTPIDDLPESVQDVFAKTRLKLCNEARSKGLDDPSHEAIVEEVAKGYAFSVDHVFLSSLGEFAGGSMMESDLLYKGFSMEQVFLTLVDAFHNTFASDLHAEGRQWGFIDYWSGKGKGKGIKQSRDEVFNTLFTGRYEAFDVKDGEKHFNDKTAARQARFEKEVQGHIDNNAYGMKDTLKWYYGELDKLMKIEDTLEFEAKLENLKDDLFSSKLVELDGCPGVPARNAVGKVKIKEYNKLEVMYARAAQGDINCTIPEDKLWAIPTDANAMMYIEEGTRLHLEGKLEGDFARTFDVTDPDEHAARIDMITNHIRQNCGSNRRADKEALYQIKSMLSHTDSPDIQLNIYGVGDTILQRGERTVEDGILELTDIYNIDRSQAGVLGGNSVKFPNGESLTFAELFHTAGVDGDVIEAMEEIKGIAAMYKHMPEAQRDKIRKELGDKFDANASMKFLSEHSRGTIANTIIDGYYEQVAGEGVDVAIGEVKRVANWDQQLENAPDAVRAIAKGLDPRLRK